MPKLITCVNCGKTREIEAYVGHAISEAGFVPVLGLCYTYGTSDNLCKDCADKVAEHMHKIEDILHKPIEEVSFAYFKEYIEYDSNETSSI